MTWAKVCVAGAGLFVVVGCQATPPPSEPSPAVLRSRATPLSTAPAITQYEDASLGIAIDVPAGWAAAPDSRREQRWAEPSGSGVLTLDVPDLDFFKRAFATIPRVRDGYVADVKKRVSDATVTDVTPPAVPFADVRRVVLSGHDAAGAVVHQEGVLIRHAEQVYVLNCAGDDASFPAAHAALDAAVASLRWVK